MNDSGHKWFAKEDFSKAVKDLEASRAMVKELEQKLGETVNKLELAEISKINRKELAENLSQKLSEALEVIRFYADVKPWGFINSRFYEPKKEAWEKTFAVICEEDTEKYTNPPLPEEVYRLGGKRAREYIKKLENAGVNTPQT